MVSDHSQRACGSEQCLWQNLGPLSTRNLGPSENKPRLPFNNYQQYHAAGIVQSAFRRHTQRKLLKEFSARRCVDVTRTCETLVELSINISHRLRRRMTQTTWLRSIAKANGGISEPRMNKVQTTYAGPNPRQKHKSRPISHAHPGPTTRGLSFIQSSGRSALDVGHGALSLLGSQGACIIKDSRIGVVYDCGRSTNACACPGQFVYPN